SIAERTIALVQEDATAAARRMGDDLGGLMPGLRVEIDSMMLDFGVMATLTIGLVSVVGGSLLLGGVMLVAAPILAMLARDRVQQEYKRVAGEQTPRLLKEVASKVGPKLAEMIDEFAKRLDAWVASAGEELHRELLEVLRSAIDARRAGAEKSAAAKLEADTIGERLQSARARLETLRASLWGAEGPPKPAAREAPSAS
ncbi:MAG: hypothetical protein ACHREM_33000, partial [Polyangiales bacterium]